MLTYKISVNVLAYEQAPPCNKWGRPGITIIKLYYNSRNNSRLADIILDALKKHFTLLMLSHWLPHPAWYICLQGRLYSIWQITHLLNPIWNGIRTGSLTKGDRITFITSHVLIFSARRNCTCILKQGAMKWHPEIDRGFDFQQPHLTRAVPVIEIK